MFIIDAFFQLFDFARALLFSGQIPQGNDEAAAYNFLVVLLNLFSFLNF